MKRVEEGSFECVPTVSSMIDRLKKNVAQIVATTWLRRVSLA